MPCYGYQYGSPSPPRKKWRYPGVPIPWRLQQKYYDENTRFKRKGEV